MDDINEMFAEAREYIEDAKEDAETVRCSSQEGGGGQPLSATRPIPLPPRSPRAQVYFNDSAAEAKEYTNAVLDKWRGLLSSLPEEERARLQRSMGLKMEQLKVRVAGAVVAGGLGEQSDVAWC